MTDKRLVVTTCGSVEEGRRIAEALVAARLAACVNIVPQIDSIYRWKGEVESASECLLLMKTTEGAFEALREQLKKLHSYDVPECIAIVIQDGSPAYLNWIGESVLAHPEK